MKIQGNTILITGGATGIGYALAESCLREGNKVIICGRRENKLQEANKKLPQLITRVCDISDDNDRNALFQWVTKNYPDLNILINNAGIQRYVDLTCGADELKNGEDEIKINFEAPIYLAALFTPFLANKKDTAIINVSSGLGFVPMARMPIYCATKAAMHSYSMTLRHQLSKVGIKVIEVIPPMIMDTELNLEGRLKSGHSARNFETPTSAEFAEVVMKGIGEDKPEIGYGSAEELRNATRADLERRFQMMNRF